LKSCNAPNTALTLLGALEMKVFKVLILLSMTAWLYGCGGGGSDNGNSTPTPPPAPVSASTVSFSTLPAGSFAVQFANKTNGKWKDEQIFIEILNKNGPALAGVPSPRLTYAALTSNTVINAPQQDGTLGMVNISSPGDNNAIGCIPNPNKNGVCYPAYSFSLAQLKNGTLYLPGDGKYYGSRIYIFLGAPLLMQVDATATGYAQPDLNNAGDPNLATVFDWYEFTYDPSVTPKVSFGGNITQVDVFSIPLVSTVKGVNGTVSTLGIPLGSGTPSGVNSRDELVAKYKATVNPLFNGEQVANESVVRLRAPTHISTLTTSTFFDNYVNSVWANLQVVGTTIFDQPGNAGTRYVSCGGGGNTLCMTRTTTDGVSVPFSMTKPSTDDIFKSAGRLQPGGEGAVGIAANAFGAILAASLNRHVAEDLQTQRWLSPSAFYPAGPKNDWAQFWHTVSISGLAYGMPFDDVAHQSSVFILTPQENVQSLTLDIGW
jgi:hypothetical protein